MKNKIIGTSSKSIFTEMDAFMEFIARMEKDGLLRNRRLSRNGSLKSASIFSAFLFTILLFSGTTLATWTKTSCPAAGNINCFAVSGSNVFAGILNGGIYVTTNNGASWTESDAGLITNSSVLSLLASGSNLFAGTYGNGVYFSNNNGVSWSSVITGLPTNSTITSLIANGAYIFAGTYGNGVYLSNNNGTSWTVVNGLSATLAVVALATNGSSIFAATQSGLFRSNDNGATWTALNGIPSSALISAIAANGSTLYATTNNNGIYYSSDNGATWTTVNNGLQGNVNFSSLTLNGSDVYAGTIGQVYHSPGATSTGIAWSLADTGLSTNNNVLSLCMVNGAALLAGTNNGVWMITLPPVAPTSFVPSNNSTNQPISMTFSWNAVSMATSYGIQISTDSTFTTSITYNSNGLTSTSLSINGFTNNTIYYWRVNATNIGGTSPWSMVNRFTTTLLSPTAVAPVNNAVNQPVSLSLSWNPVATATTYGLQVSTDSTFSSSIIFSQSGLTTTSQALSGLLNNTVYYWRINATNSGGTSAWSGNSHFTTIVSIPATPSLGLPSNNVSGQPVSLALSWYMVTSASSYALQVSTDSTFASSIIYGQSNLTATIQAITGLNNNTTYFWRVNATNMAGTGPWSTTNRFTTIIATPTLVSPVSGTINMPVSFTISWTSVTAATSYGLQVSSDSTFNTSLIVSQTGLTATSQTISGLNNSTVYYWRVNATNSGGTSAWSIKNNFTTIVIMPLSPTPLSPLNGATNQAVSLGITWAPVASATSYALQVSTDSTFASSVIFSQTGISGASQTINGLANSTTYYWRVLATNLAGSSPWSSVSGFSTIISAPTLEVPANLATGQPLSVTFQWDPVAHAAATYTLQISTDSNFVSSLFYNQNGLTAVTQTVNNMLNNTVYFWRVNATCSSGTSPWSIKNRFTTAIAGPTLVSPVNNASNQPVSLALAWSAIASATSYSLQVSTDSTFSHSIVSSMTGLTSTTQTVNGLNNSTTYYWRTNATNAGGTSLWSSVASFTTIIPSPTQELPINTATGEPLSVNFGWDPISANATYTLQVSTDSNFLSVMAYNQSGLTATTQTVNNLANTTVYYWRINATYNGSTSQWSTKFHFSTVLAAPVLTSPVNKASNQPISITATWGQVLTATSYALQVSTDSTFATSLVYNQSGLTALSQVVSGLVNNTVYYWRVNASNTGSTSAWSTTSSFATILLPPTLSAPANGSTNMATAVTLVWNPVSSANYYGLQVSTDSTFASVTFSQTGITATSQNVSGLLNSSTYYWRVNSANSSSTGSWSSKFHFTTIIGSSSAPTVIAPASGSVGQPITLTLSWNSVSYATTYGLQVSTDSTFSGSFVYNQTGLTATTQILSGLVNNTLYYWHVNAGNSGSTSAWSATSSFATVMVAPTLSTPTNISVNQPTSITFTWYPVGSATSYTLQVSQDGTFTSANYNQNGLTGTSQTVTGLANNVVYYWRVSATGPKSTSNWSSVYYFTTVVAPLSAPTQYTPGNNATDQSIAPTFSWSALSGALSYALQVSTDSTFSSSFAYNQSGITTTAPVVSGLSNSTAYYWRVSATNIGGMGIWSPAFRFTTTILAPSPATPANNTVNQPVSLTLSWNPVASSISYGLQVSTDTTFAAAAVFNQSGLTSTSQALTGLANNTTYCWRINATSALGTSAWSAKNRFTTIMVQTLAVPTVASPSNGATNQPTTLKLSWNPVASTSTITYSLQVSSDSTFAANVIYSQSGITGTSQTVNGLANSTVYYWRLNAANTTGGSSVWSSAFSFLTATPAPTPISPTSTVSQSMTFQWNPVASATSYAVQVSTDSTFNSLIVFNQSGITGTSVTSGNLASGTVYYWHVNATNANGTSVWSSPNMFTTIAAAPAPISPINSATDVAVALTLSWSPVKSATAYSLQVSTDSTFASPKMFTGTGTSQAITGLLNNTTYFWRVATTNAGGTSAWSARYQFTTIVAAPAAPVLSNSSNNSTTSTITLSLAWDSVANATSYLMQIAKDSLFAQIVYSESGPATAAQVTGLSMNYIYYWRVNATNAGGTSAWSVPNFFKVQSSAVLKRLSAEIPKALDLSAVHYLKGADEIRISYAVPVDCGRVTIRLFDMQGNTVSTLVDGTAAAGFKTLSVNRRTTHGLSIGSGTYILRMEATNFAKSKVFMLP